MLNLSLRYLLITIRRSDLDRPMTGVHVDVQTRIPVIDSAVHTVTFLRFLDIEYMCISSFFIVIQFCCVVSLKTCSSEPSSHATACSRLSKIGIKPTLPSCFKLKSKP